MATPQWTAAARGLLETAKDVDIPAEVLQAEAQRFFNRGPLDPSEELNNALRVLAEGFSLPDVERAGFLMVVCGAIIENGADPDAVAGPLTDQLRSWLTGAAAVHDACDALMPEESDEEETTDAGTVQVADENEDDEDPFEAAMEQVSPTMPAQANAWLALNHFYMAPIAVYSRSRAAREAARDLRPLADRISSHNAGGHWLNEMLSVLNDEPLLAIEPSTGIGITARMNGIVENFQLHVLLMDAFPKATMFAPRRVSKEAAAVASGEGPQTLEDIITGAWNPYTWQALQPDGVLPDPANFEMSRFWVWNEGKPEDIPLFDGWRVVLLGPPAYARTWRAQRAFASLPAELADLKRLSEKEVKDWLRRMAAAQR